MISKHQIRKMLETTKAQAKAVVGLICAQSSMQRSRSLRSDAESTIRILGTFLTG